MKTFRKFSRYFQITVSLTLFIANLLMLLFSLFFREMVYAGTEINMLFFDIVIPSQLLSGFIGVISFFIIYRKIPKNVVYDDGFTKKVITVVTIVVYSLCVLGVFWFINSPEIMENGIIPGISRGNSTSRRLLVCQFVTTAFTWFWFVVAKCFTPGSKYHIEDNKTGDGSVS